MPRDVISQMTEGIAQSYRLEKRLRQTGNVEMAERITVGSVILASSFAIAGSTTNERK